MEAVILAGGKGTRLQPYTNEIPKPLVPLGNRPIIEILLRHLRRSGVTKAHLAVNHLSHLIVAVLGDGGRLGMAIDYIVEDKPLSTVGPLSLMKNLPEKFLVANGDILTDLEASELYGAHMRSGAILTVATQQRTERIDFGVLECDADNRVIGFREKPKYDFAVSMGMYIFSRELLQYVPTNQAFGFDELILRLLAQKQRVMQYPYSGFWLDIGRPDDYERAIRDQAMIEELLA